MQAGYRFARSSAIRCCTYNVRKVPTEIAIRRTYSHGGPGAPVKYVSDQLDARLRRPSSKEATPLCAVLRSVSL